MTSTIFSVAFPSIEAAVSHLGERVLGAAIVIETAPVTYETESDPGILRAQRDGWQDTAVSRGNRLDEATATIERLKGKLEVTGEVMQDNLNLKEELRQMTDAWREAMSACHDAENDAANLDEETKRLHALWHEAQHALDLLRDHHKEVQGEVNNYEECIKRHAEAMSRSRSALAECQSGNRTLATERDAFKTVAMEMTRKLDTARAEADRYENLWIEVCGQARAAAAQEHPTAGGVPQYRMLEVGEQLMPTDEVDISGQWQTFGMMGIIRHLKEGVTPVGYYRRKVS